MRGIISWLIFFSAGVLCAGSYFYRLHPEKSPETDLPRVRAELEEAVDRARRLKQAWEGTQLPADAPNSAQQADPKPAAPPAAEQAKPEQPAQADVSR